MKKILSIILALTVLTFLFPSSNVSAKEEVIWQESNNGMEFGFVSTIAVDPLNPSTVLGTYVGGIFKASMG